MSRSYPALAAGLSILLLSSGAHARIEDDVVNARVLGMGGAFRALVFENSAIDLNPAGLPQVKRVSLSFDYKLDDANNGYDFIATVVDALSGPVASGIAYSYTNIDSPDSDGTARGQKFLLGFGGQVAERLYFGTTARYIQLDFPGASDSEDVQTYTFDLGVLARATEFLSFGVTFNNLLDEDRAELPFNIAAGTALVWKSVGMIAADIVMDTGSGEETLYGYHLGAQVSATKSVALRAGYRVDRFTEDATVSTGIGYLTETWWVDYALQLPDGDQDPTHMISFNMMTY